MTIKYYFLIILLVGFFALSGSAYAATGITISLNQPYSSSKTADPNIEWELLCCTPQFLGKDSTTGLDILVYPCDNPCVGDIGLGEDWTVKVPLPCANDDGVTMLRLEYPGRIVAGDLPDGYDQNIYSANQLATLPKEGNTITMTGTAAFNECGNDGVNMPVKFYAVKGCSINTDDCPSGSVVQDGICVKSVKTSVVYSTDNCPADSKKQDGICIKSTMPTPIVVSTVDRCPSSSGFVVRDGICIKAVASDICGDGVKYGAEECDGADSISCPGTCTTECECPLNTSPYVTDSKVSPDYCTTVSGAGVISFNWQYNDDDGDEQTKFEFQVDNNSNFGSLEVDRVFSDSTAHSQQVVVSATAGPLSYNNTTYYWRVRVYDDHNNPSNWHSGSFTTDSHAWPHPSFSATPASAPLINGADKVSFADSSVCYEVGNNDGYFCSDEQHSGNTYLWQFGDGTPSDDTKGNIFHNYIQYGSYSPTLKVTDDVGWCKAEGTVKVINPYTVPEWKEVSPF